MSSSMEAFIMIGQNPERDRSILVHFLHGETYTSLERYGITRERCRQIVVTNCRKIARDFGLEPISVRAFYLRDNKDKFLDRVEV